MLSIIIYPRLNRRPFWASFFIEVRSSYNSSIEYGTQSSYGHSEQAVYSLDKNEKDSVTVESMDLAVVNKCITNAVDKIWTMNPIGECIAKATAAERISHEINFTRDFCLAQRNRFPPLKTNESSIEKLKDYASKWTVIQFRRWLQLWTYLFKSFN